MLAFGVLKVLLRNSRGERDPNCWEKELESALDEKKKIDNKKTFKIEAGMQILKCAEICLRSPAPNVKSSSKRIEL